MRTSPFRRSGGFALVELALLLTLLALLVVGVIILNPFPRRSHQGSSRIVCVNNLKQVGLAFRIWSNDHEENFPWAVRVKQGGIVPDEGRVGMHFGELVDAYSAISNELTLPKILVCPTDTKQRATGFEATAEIPFGGRRPLVSSSNLTYFAGWEAQERVSNTILSGDPNFGGALPAGEGETGRSGRVKMYQVARPGDSSLLQKKVEWDRSLHQEKGNLGLSDGSVMQLNSDQLRAVLANGVSDTNLLRARLVVPAQ